MKFIKIITISIVKKKAYFYWFPRFFGLLLIPGFIFDTEVLIFFQGLLVLHANLGLKAIAEDYLHIEIIKKQFLYLIRTFSILIISLNILYLL